MASIYTNLEACHIAATFTWDLQLQSTHTMSITYDRKTQEGKAQKPYSYSKGQGNAQGRLVIWELQFEAY